MNKLFLSLALAGATFFAQDTFAQKSNANISPNSKMERPEMKAKTPEQSAEHVAKNMQKRYELTDAQTTKVQAVNLKFAQDVKALKEKDKAANTDALRATYTAAVKGILTADQYTKFAADLAEAEKQGPKGKPDHAQRQGKPDHAQRQGKPDHAQNKADLSKDKKDKTKLSNEDKIKTPRSEEGKADKGPQRRFDVYRMLGDHKMPAGKPTDKGVKTETPASTTSDKAGKMK